jgi:hypothetical protein
VRQLISPQIKYHAQYVCRHSPESPQNISTCYTVLTLPYLWGRMRGRPIYIHKHRPRSWIGVSMRTKEISVEGNIHCVICNI